MSEERVNNITILDREGKIRKWMRDHKKEIIIAVGAAGLTSFVFVKFGHRTLPKNPYMSVRFEAGMEERFPRDEDGNHIASGHIFMDLKDLKVSDLGAAGKKMMETFPKLKADTPLRRISMDYNFKV